MDIEKSPHKRKAPTPSNENENQEEEEEEEEEEEKKIQNIIPNQHGKIKKEPQLESRD